MALPDLSIERELGGCVAGIDEAGRGPLAGPVVAAAVILPTDLPPELSDAIDDSKKLAPGRREALYGMLIRCADVSVAQADVGEIDTLNILQATFTAMSRALDGLAGAPDAALVDGNRLPALSCHARAVVRGDARSLSIAAASIAAKVVRDRAMAALAADFPGYGWERNAGYGTAEHLAALARLGPTPHHRRSFAPVARAFARAG